MGDDEPDAIVADPPPVEEPSSSRTKTAERPQPGRKITLDLEDPDALADFLIEVSRLVRERKRISVTIE